MVAFSAGFSHSLGRSRPVDNALVSPLSATPRRVLALTANQWVGAHELSKNPFLAPRYAAFPEQSGFA